MSAIGPERTWVCAPHMSAFGGKADAEYHSEVCRGAGCRRFGAAIVAEKL